MKSIIWICYLLSSWFVGSGFYKLFCYKNAGEASLPSQNVNAYVGGDAFNYIINSQVATGYFVLALLFVILGSTFLIIENLKNKQQKEAV